jgi:hypothetical protein
MKLGQKVKYCTEGIVANARDARIKSYEIVSTPIIRLSFNKNKKRHPMSQMHEDSIEDRGAFLQIKLRLSMF